MSALSLSKHPIMLAAGWASTLGPGWIAEFSKYRYIPQSFEDQRERIKVPLDEVTSSWLRSQFLSLESGQDLAMHSRLTLDRRVRHIPMIDCATSSRQSVRELQSLLSGVIKADVRLFWSGRSFHCYGIKPVTVTGWARLMGIALLANLPDVEPIVDTRWVGHRLLGGYSALRWSANSPHYLQFPREVSL